MAQTKQRYHIVYSMFLPSLFGAMHILLEACKITTSSNSFDFTCEGICACLFGLTAGQKRTGARNPHFSA